MEFGLIIIGVLLLGITSTINQLRIEITRTNSTLEKIAKEIGVPDTIIDNIDDELRNLIAKFVKTNYIW